MISDIINAVSGFIRDINNGKSIDNSEKNAAGKLFGKHKSIASMAKKSIMDYPVIISSGIADDPDNALKIVKHTENVYALFYSLAAGLNPIVQDDKTIASHLGQFGNESLGISWSYKLLKDSEKDNSYRIEMENLQNDKYKTAKDYLSVEADDKHFHQKTYNGSVLTGSGTGKADTDDISSKVSFQGKVIEKLLGKKMPTVLNIDVYSGRNKITISIAVRAVPHFINQLELDALFDSLMGDKQKFLRVIQLTTGEISFFRDFVLQMDRIKRDQRLYASLGSHPLYRVLMSKKNWSIGQAIANLNQSIRDLISGKSEILPTFTIMCTMDEICRALKMTPRKVLDNPKVITRVMDHLMLLGFIIFDRNAEIIYSYYSSFATPQIITLKEMKKGGGDKAEDAIADLIKFMQGMVR